MKQHLLSLVVGLLASIAAIGQTQTATFKPGPLVGEDAPVLINTGACSWWQTGNDSDAVNIFAICWTYNNLGCGTGTSRSLLRFSELSNIPANATVTSATLKLYGVSSSIHSADGNAGNNECIIARVTSPWAENAVTWNTQPTISTVNQIITPATTSVWNWNYTNNSANLVSMVQQMVSTPTQNYGFMFMLQSENIYSSLVFASSDHPNSALWPELIVTYTVPQDTCNTNFEYTLSTLSPNQANFIPVSPSLQSNYSWTINSNTYAGQSLTHTFPGNGSYTACLLQQTGNGTKCAATCAAVCIGNGVGLKESQFEQGFEVNVAPNPTHNDWSLLINAPKNVYTNIALTDLSGKQVLTQNAMLRMGSNDIKISAESLTSGIYFLKMVSDQGKVIVHSKLIKE